MKKLKLKEIRILELARIIDQIPLNELKSPKEIRMSVNIVNDLESQIKDLIDEQNKFNLERTELLKPYRERFNNESVDLSEEEKKVLSSKIDKDFADKYGKKITKENESLIKKGDVYKEFELGEDKFEKLKEWFEKFGTDKYLNKNVYLEVCDALEL